MAPNGCIFARFIAPWPANAGLDAAAEGRRTNGARGTDGPSNFFDRFAAQPVITVHAAGCYLRVVNNAVAIRTITALAVAARLAGCAEPESSASDSRLQACLDAADDDIAVLLVFGIAGILAQALECELANVGEDFTVAFVERTCVYIDENPSYASNTIFSKVGKAEFAGGIRASYEDSSVLRELVQGSGYWAASNETVPADTVITQTSNSCETNIGFINAVCFDVGPQFTSGDNYNASGAVNSGGCDETKL